LHRTSIPWEPTRALTCINVPVWCPAFRRSAGTACSRDSAVDSQIKVRPQVLAG
jgi:hypothetical protein